MTALDRVLPEYQFHEFHARKIHATPERIYASIKAVTADEIRFFRALTWIRRFGRPLPPSILSAPKGLGLLDLATRTTFVTLADGPDEILVGTVVMRPPGEPRPRTADEFLALRQRRGFALAVMNFAIGRIDNGTSVVSTETRVYATNASVRRRFAAYWFVIHGGSALIRRMWLQGIQRRAESRERPASTTSLERVLSPKAGD